MTPDNEQTRQVAAGTIETVERVERFAQQQATTADCDYIGYPTDADQELGEVLDYAALEVSTVYRESWEADSRSIDVVEVLLGFGGPNIYAKYHRDGRVVIDVYWGADHETTYAYAPDTAFWLFDVAEMREVGR